MCLLDSLLTIGDEKGCASLQHRVIAWQRLVSNISPSARPIMRSHLKPGSYRPNLETVRSIISRREGYPPQRCHFEVRGVAVSPSHVLESCQQPSTSTARSSSANRTGDTTWSEISAAYRSAAIARTILCKSSRYLVGMIILAWTRCCAPWGRNCIRFNTSWHGRLATSLGFAQERVVQVLCWYHQRGCIVSCPEDSASGIFRGPNVVDKVMRHWYLHWTARKAVGEQVDRAMVPHPSDISSLTYPISPP